MKRIAEDLINDRHVKKPRMEIDYLNLIPKEIWTVILGYLDYQHVIPLETVSKLWMKVIREIRFDSVIWVDLKDLNRVLLHKFTSFDFIDQDLSDSHLQLIVEILAEKNLSLTKIYLGQINNLTENGLQCLKTCTKIEIEELENASNDKLQYFQKCQKFFARLEKNNRLTDEGLKYLENCTDLKLIFNDSSHSITGSGFQYMTKLTKIDICIEILEYHQHFSNCTKIKLLSDVRDDDLQHFTRCRNLWIAGEISGSGFKYMTNLEKLSINDTDTIEEESFQHLTKLKSFQLRACNELEGTGLKFLANCEEVRINSILSNFENVSALKKCKTLELFESDDKIYPYLSNIENLVLISPQVFEPKMENLANCVSFELHGYCRSINYQSLFGVKELWFNSGIADSDLKHLEKCRKIFFKDCLNVTDDGFQYLANCEEIHIQNCSNVSQKLFRHLSNAKKICVNNEIMQYLKSFEMEENIFPYLPECRELRISFCKVTGCFEKILKNPESIKVWCKDLQLLCVNDIRII